MAIDREVSAARHTCHAVDGEADRLIEHHPEIEQDERQEQRVDDWSGQKAEEVAFKNVCGNALTKPPVGLSKLLVEPDQAAVNAILPSALLIRGPRSIYDARGFEPIKVRERDTVVRLSAISTRLPSHY